MGYTKLNNSGIKRENSSDGLEGPVLKFVRDYCEGLRFDEKKTERERAENIYLGRSAGENQIPYNMQMDIDRLCLENALSAFLETGKKEDAFNVYFCYLEMFTGDYEKCRRMIELLSEYEANGSGLLMKHRDHYSHSVYVFCLGLAVYASCSFYRDAYKAYYSLKEEHEAACHYLEYWGMASLFHDIGYPFELPFEQVASYFEVEGEERSKRPYVAYKGLDAFRAVDKAMQRKLGSLLKLSENDAVATTDELFAHVLYKKLGKIYYFSEAEMLDVLKAKPVEPNRYGHFMDHAYFSATVLFKKLFCELKCELKQEHIDALTAILLHNSLYKFCIAYYKNAECNIPFDMELHPLAYMLMLCDELQCWDRTAYGRNSKLELHPKECIFDFSRENVIGAEYQYEEDLYEGEKGKIKRFEEEYEEWDEDRKSKKPKLKTKPKLKAYSGMYMKEKIVRNDGTTEEVTEFQADIERIVDLTKIKLVVSADSVEEEQDEEGQDKHRGYLSDSNFISLYNFAAALNARWLGRPDMTEQEMYKEFRTLSLEYKLSNINQAKSFAKHLTEIQCFYTDRPVDFEMVTKFEPEELGIMGPREHARWLEEHYAMGWSYIDRKELQDMVKQETGIEDVHSDKFKAAFTRKREELRRHWDMIPDFDCSKELTKVQVEANYERIGQEEQDKDTEPMTHMLNLLKKFDGLRIYRLNPKGLRT